VAAPEWYPTPTWSVCRALENMGGWSRYFNMSAPTYDSYNVVARERSTPDFWILYARALADEQLDEAVLEAIKVFLKEHRGHPLSADRERLRMELGRALLRNGWKPKITAIKKEIATKKRERREDIAALRASLQKKRRKNDEKN
jgi:hypothetical protein